MGTEFHRLGDYIREVNVRNRELKVTKLVGLTIDKAFIPSVANVIGTDLSNYKVIRREQFACSLMQVSRDGRMPVAMFEEDNAIMSPAYPMFEVVDKTKLLPQYLMMWFSRSEFDREASYYAVGGVRGSLTWEDFCNMKLPVPSIERQREVVSEYETLTRRIRLNEQMIEKLETTAQALYRHTFVDNIDKQNLPQGWHLATLGEVGEIVSGATPKTEIPEYWSDNNNEGIAWISPADLSKQGTLYIARGNKSITNAGYNSCSTIMLPAGSMLFSSRAPIGLMAIAANEVCTNQGFKSIVLKEDYMREYLFMTLQNEKDIIAGEGSGSTFDEISAQTFKNYTITLPSNEVILVFHNQVEPIFHAINIKQQENIKLTELQSLLLAKMGQ